MKKIIFILFIYFSFISCSNKYGPLESKLKKQVEEKIVPNLDNPKSFELVSIKTTDTIMYHYYIKQLKKISEDNIKESNIELVEILKDSVYSSDLIKAIKESINSSQENLKGIDSLLALPDRVININLEVKMRAKNKLNALVLQTLKFTYNPKDKSFDWEQD